MLQVVIVVFKFLELIRYQQQAGNSRAFLLWRMIGGRFQCVLGLWVNLVFASLLQLSASNDLQNSQSSPFLVVCALSLAIIRAPGPAVGAVQSAPRVGMQTVPAYAVKPHRRTAFATIIFQFNSEALLCSI